MAQKLTLRKAVKRTKKLRMFLSGVSGSGKTYTALAVGTALAKLDGGAPVVLFDTEASSAELYAHRFDFLTAQIEAPFDPQKFIDALAVAAEAGAGVVIIDSISHAWNGAGGLLEMVDQFAQTSTGKRGNAFTNGWSKGTPIQQRLFEAILRSPFHIIVCARAKTEYVIERDDKGRDVPVKIGLAPVQRADVEYEFDVMMEIGIDHVGRVVKARLEDVADKVFVKPGADFAALLHAELQGEEGAGNHSPVVMPTAEQVAELDKLGAAVYGAEWRTPAHEQQTAEWASKGAIKTIDKLSAEEVKTLIAALQRKQAAAAEKVAA